MERPRRHDRRASVIVYEDPASETDSTDFAADAIDVAAPTNSSSPRPITSKKRSRSTSPLNSTVLHSTTTTTTTANPTPEPPITPAKPTKRSRTTKPRTAAKPKPRSAAKKKHAKDYEDEDSDGIVASDSDDFTPNSRASFTIPPEPTRRSYRTRNAPKDPYTEQLLALSPKRKAPVKRAAPSRKKKMPEDEKWAPENLVMKTSPFVTADLSRLLNSDIITRDNLPEEDYDALIALLPAEFIVYRTTTDVSGEDPKPQINPELYECVFFKEAVRNFQNDLGAGKYEPAYISKGKEARRKRLAGDFDSWKDAQFELHWGDKQRLYSEAIAGESSKIRLITLIKHHQFRVGDVFSMRRGFFGGATVRKDAVLTKIGEDFSMSFSYPPGRAEWSRDGIKDKTVDKVTSLTALENLLCQENDLAPRVLPNGNAFKTIRVIRNKEDIGCVFDIRAKFHSQYLGSDEEED